MRATFEDFFSEKDLSCVNWNTWFYSPGIPEEDLTEVNSYALKKVESLASKIMTDRNGSGFQLQRSDMYFMGPQQVIILLDKLREGFNKDTETRNPVILRHKMKRMNEMYDFDSSENAEIRFRWLMLALECGDRSRYQAAASMASEFGRMKFCRPLYRALNAVDPALAKSTFAANGHKLHPIAKKMVSSDLS